MTDLAALAGEAGPKAILYAALLVAIGASTCHWLLLSRLIDRSHGDRRDGASRALVDLELARLSVIAAAAMLGAQLVRGLTHTASVFGWGDAIGQLSVILLESRWGSGWRVQTAAAVCLLAAALSIRLSRPLGWILVTSAVVACSASMPLLGHAAGNSLDLVLHTVHVLSAGLWLGTLACVLLVSTATGDWLRVFSPIALTGACLAAAAGAIAAVQYVGTASNLWTTAYGRALLLKLGLFAGVVACGYRNWRRWSAVRSGEDVPKGAEVREVALALAIVLVTSVLTELAHP